MSVHPRRIFQTAFCSKRPSENTTAQPTEEKIPYAAPLVLQRPDIGRCDLSFLPPLPIRPSENGNGSILRFEVPENFALPPEASAELDKLKIDHAVLPAIPFSDLGLIVSDMDSTLITIECVDEIAAGVGLERTSGGDYRTIHARRIGLRTIAAQTRQPVGRIAGKRAARSGTTKC